MKKRFFTIGALALTLAVVIGYGVKTSMNNDVQLNDLARANVEALARAEVGGGTPCGGPLNLEITMCEARNSYNCRDRFACR